MYTDENGFQVVPPWGEAEPIFERLYYPCPSVSIPGFSNSITGFRLMPGAKPLITGRGKESE